MIAYTLRAVVCITLFVLLLLMVCGCLYIYEHFLSKKAAVKTAVAGYGMEAQEVYRFIPTAKETKNADVGFAVVLDAGHGGPDGGTHAGSVYEKDINLSMVLMLGEKLKAQGVRVVNTRVQDEKVSLDERVAIANTGNEDVFVSIHCNSYEDDTGICGFQCYYDGNSAEGKSLAGRISAAVENGNVTNVREAKAENYHVTRETAIPAVLIEIGYLTNERERGNLTDKSYLEGMADLIARGILDELNSGKENLWKKEP